MADFLNRCRNEAKKMSIYEYDEERQRRFDREEGMDCLAELIDILVESGKSELIFKVTKDKEYRDELLKEYKIL